MYDSKKIDEIINNLPQEMRELLISDDLLNKLDEVAELNKINEDDYEIILEEIISIILRETSVNEFTNTLVAYGIDSKLVNLMNKEIEKLIFSKFNIKNREEVNDKISNVDDANITRFDKNKIIEISKKYSLDNNQTDKLINLVSLVVNDPKDPGVFLEKITSELGISSLLAEQIVNELKSRVLENRPKQIVESVPTPLIKSNIPEIRPNNLPMQGSNFIPNPKPAFQNETLDKQKTPQTTYPGVPRYATGNTEVNAVGTVPSNKSDNAGNIIENKLNNVTTGIRETPPIKYEKDPYREPLG